MVHTDCPLWETMKLISIVADLCADDCALDSDARSFRAIANAAKRALKDVEA